MNELNLSADELDFLLSPAAIRDRAGAIFDLCRNGKTAFEYHPERLQPTVDFVLQVIRKNYPDLRIPFHSRWGHFRAGGVDRAAALDDALKSYDAMERARIKLDLVITSVLLDAGAGDPWSYREASSGQTFARSEGLGVASYHMFLSGAMSSDRRTPRADAEGLMAVTADDLRAHFQVDERNPLIGVEGRVQLLNNLGRLLKSSNIIEGGRPGHLIDALAKQGRAVPATVLLRTVLDGLGPIWPGRLSANGVNLGDVWRHSTLGPADSPKSLVPFHKLSQWMTYSLIEPIEDAGLRITGVDQLTGLAEYRNGGLMIDSGLITLRDPSASLREWPPGSDLVIEWRALTVGLLDVIGAAIQTSLGRTAQDFPLAKVLEGGTWWAGREWAKKLRAGGGPPIRIQSDGTVF